MMWFWILFWWFFCVPNAEFFPRCFVFRRSRCIKGPFRGCAFRWAVEAAKKALRNDPPAFFFGVGHCPERVVLSRDTFFKAFILEFGVQVLAYRRRCLAVSRDEWSDSSQHVTCVGWPWKNPKKISYRDSTPPKIKMESPKNGWFGLMF